MITKTTFITSLKDGIERPILRWSGTTPETSGRLRKMYTRSRRRTSSGEVRRDSLNKFRPILGGISIV